MFEVWKPIVGYEGLYEVSNLGRVMACPKNGRSERYLRPAIVGLYPSVKLVKDGIYKNKYIHRLVAEAFIPNPSGLPEVNHRDENKLNPRLDNLEWCSRKYNVNYGSGQQRRKNAYNSNNNKQILRGECNPRAKLTIEVVKYIRSVYCKNSRIYGARALGRRFGVSHNTIRALVEGRTWCV